MFTRGDCRQRLIRKRKVKGKRATESKPMQDACYSAKGTKTPPAAQTDASSPAWALCSLMKASTLSLSLGITRTISYASKDIRETTQKEKKLRGLEVGKAQSWSRWCGWRWRRGLTTREAEKALTPPHSPGFPGPLDRHWKLPMGEGT